MEDVCRKGKGALQLPPTLNSSILKTLIEMISRLFKILWETVEGDPHLQWCGDYTMETKKQPNQFS